MRFFTLLAIAAPLVVSAQTVHKVVVGSSKGQTIFTPEAIGAQPGDIVTFEFQQKNHSVVQSSFANPCGPADGGFNSGYMPVPPDQTSDFPTYNITVPDEKPIWVYCSQKNPAPHCGLGMVFAVNCGQAGAPNSFDNFKAAALAQGAAFASSASANPYASPTPAASSTDVASALSPAPTAASGSGGGVVHQVTVGENGALAFDPPHIAAAISDTVVFTFKTKNHTVTQSTFGNPCLKLNNATTGQVGLDSDFMPVAAGSTDFPTYTLTVNDTKPLWLYCRQKNPISHCGAGMVFAINTDESTTSTKTFSDFVGMAKSLNGTAASDSTGNSSSASAPGSAAPAGSGALQLSVAGTLGLLALTTSLMSLL